MASGNITSPTSTVTLIATGSERTLIVISGTYSGVAIKIQAGPDGSNWAPVKAASLDGSLYGSSFALIDNTTYVFEVAGVPPGNQIQVAATAWANGSASVVINSPPTPRHGSKSAPVSVSVGTTATQILAANVNRISAEINNNIAGNADIYLGRDNTVTVATGIPLVAGGTRVDTSTNDAWWGITASGSADIRPLEVS